MNTALTLTSIRPASGRPLVRVGFCHGFDMPSPLSLSSHLNTAYATQAAARLRVGGQFEAHQVPPGGGRA
ncbi:hypothetical protein [Variovorax sp. EBFNA2]|uniref:hypothetical protein n=1 Tax=Variovorax sp. EBFNA2 TaxID=3342097 RepID=UPI0029BFD09A|nr:hypothetical protein [Variovorax boronicumulans]WPG36361.1 hypothetical protein RZE79_23150 [Variovorax boronicumulans]